MMPINAFTQNAYWYQRVSLFDKLPIKSSDIVFLGNSITDGGEFSELFKMENCRNRGINSDVISGVSKRLHQVTNGKPKKIFLLIGINDVSHGKSASQIAAEYEKLVERIRTESPETELYLQSVMPINNSFNRYKNLQGRQDVIPELNEKIKDMAGRHQAVYIDLWEVLADTDGTLKKEYTNDGLHLLGAGYKAWGKAIEPYVKSSQK